ncbi:MAG: M67 family metallopeptidase [Acidobacteria bacterium]|nr:M67 family metallopeptidase [Acidobacteriota bacterium]
MALSIEQKTVDAIRQHGARDYPNECCGMLLGQADGDQKRVLEAVPLRNLRTVPAEAQKLLPLESPGRESERNRFLIDPREQIRVEKEARARGVDVVGYYHSHPDHPARPSNYDREHAWPWYSYVILSVTQGQPADLTGWVLTENRERFDPEPVEIL